MVQQFPSAMSPGREGIMRTSVLASPSPMRPTSNKNPLASPSPAGKGYIGNDQGAPNAAVDRTVQLSEELKELKEMYKKVVEAQTALRAEFKTSEEQRIAAEQRAEAAEMKLALCTKCEVEAEQRAEAAERKLAKCAAARPESSPCPQQRVETVFDKQEAALSSALERRLFEASESAKKCEGTPRQRGIGASPPVEGVTGFSARSPCVPPPVPSAPSMAQRRLSFSGTGGTDSACKEQRASDSTPTRAKQGFVIVSTPQSDSVRDRIKALEGK